jgi:hypothetical protein
MVIDPKTERPTRTMLGHAMRHELKELSAMVSDEGSETLLGAIALCVFASGYLAIDVCGRWPTEADLREIARGASQSSTQVNLAGSDVYEYLSRVALGAERFDVVFPASTAGLLPLLITANLLANFRPRDKHWWEYLDQIWDAAETADRTPVSVLPALMLRARGESARAAQETEP